MRTPFVAGNWKMNTDRASGTGLAKLVASESAGLGGRVQVGVAPPLVYLDAIKQALGTNGAVLLGAQNFYFEDRGAFTGEVSAAMLRDVGCQFALVGHSERRHVLGEATEMLAKKAAAAYNAGLTVVHCVGETLEERDANRTLDVVERQLAELSPNMTEAQRVVVAYEPVWAIGTGRTASSEQAQEVHAHVRSILAESFDKEFADGVRIIYGGSVNAENAAGLLGQADVDGALVGGASLKADSFLPILRAAAESNKN